MPIVTIGGGLVYFAHVPKAAGTSVVQYLEQRFGPLGFMDSQFTRWPEQSCWSKSSPQHLDQLSLSRLFPPGFFRAAFTVVRHPVSRLRSVYLFQRDGSRRIAPDMSFSDWLAHLPQARADNPFYLDNHPRPMDDIVPADCRVFKLEQGLSGLIGWLDQQAGNQGGARQLPLKNNFQNRMAHQGRDSKPVHVTAADRALIGRLYAQDFIRFGYQAEDEKEGFS